MRLCDVRKLLGVLIFGCALLAMPMSAMADSILTLNSEPAHTVGPQSASAPCIIAGTTCQNGGFPYNNFTQTGNVTAYDEKSPIYDIAELPFLMFNVAIDVNTAKDAETLDLFEVFLGDVATGTRLYHYDGGGVIGTVSSNGNGYADWTLRSIDLSSYQPDQTVQFHAVYHNASDGAESFFIINAGTPPPPTVPEPTSLILLGTGLSGLALVAWRRRKS